MICVLLFSAVFTFPRFALSIKLVIVIIVRFISDKIIIFAKLKINYRKTIECILNARNLTGVSLFCTGH